MADLSKYIRDVPDFPQKGIIFKDITTLLKDKRAFKSAVDIFDKKYSKLGIEKVVAVESRGFILGAVIAYKLGAGFVPARKPGKLPAETLKQEYALEYGKDAVEIHKDAIKKGEKVLIIDDLLATGGTLSATCKLVETLGGQIVAVACLIELTFLKGIEKLKGYNFYSVIKY